MCSDAVVEVQCCGERERCVSGKSRESSSHVFQPCSMLYHVTMCVTLELASEGGAACRGCTHRPFPADMTRAAHLKQVFAGFSFDSGEKGDELRCFREVDRCCRRGRIQFNLTYAFRVWYFYIQYVLCTYLEITLGTVKKLFFFFCSWDLYLFFDKAWWNGLFFSFSLKQSKYGCKKWNEMINKNE